MVKSTTLVDDDLWKFTDGKDDAMTWYAMSHDDFYKQIYHRDDGPAYVSTNGTKNGTVEANFIEWMDRR